MRGKVLVSFELEKMSKRSGINYSEEQYKIYETEGGYAPLDGSYTVFGEVIEGFDVLDKIAAVATNRANRPKEDVTMTIKIVKR